MHNSQSAYTTICDNHDHDSYHYDYHKESVVAGVSMQPIAFEPSKKTKKVEKQPGPRGISVTKRKRKRNEKTERLSPIVSQQCGGDLEHGCVGASAGEICFRSLIRNEKRES